MAASGLGKCDLMWCEHDEHHRCSQSQVHFDYDFVVWVMTIQRWLTVIAFKRSQRKLLTAFDSAKEYRWLSQDFHDTSLSPHQLESSSTTPLQQIDLIALNADVLVRYFYISRKSIPCRCCRFLRFQHKYFRHISTTLLKIGLTIQHGVLSAVSGLVVAGLGASELSTCNLLSLH